MTNFNLQLTSEEWNFLKKFIIEDALEFHASVYNEMKEFAPDLTNELYDISNESEFTKHRELFLKLKKLGINTFGLEEEINGK
jgi:hypothetical protein